MTMLAASNLLIPLLTGLFILAYFLYFVMANPSKAASFRYLVIFLIGFSVFLFGRPLQLVLGPYPLPLIIVNVRVFILCAVISPAIILASDVVSSRRPGRREYLIVLACVLLGLTYVLFNTLGTKASYPLFEVAGIAVRDNLTPSLSPPFYGREVTIAVQVITGTLLLVFSLLKLVRIGLRSPVGETLRDKNFLINMGIVIFACSFIIGSLAKQWWVYYVASILTALLFGAGVVIDIKQVHDYYEKLIPFIKEDIIHNVTFSKLSRTKLAEMLSCLGKRTSLNTFAITAARQDDAGPKSDLVLLDEVITVTDRRVAEIWADDMYLLLPLSDSKVGIVVQLGPTTGTRADLVDALEAVHEEVFRRIRRPLATGIGRSYDRIEDLRSSYHEAATAQEYAEQFVGQGVVHVDDIRGESRQASRYPVKEKERLLTLIRQGDVENCRRAAADFAAGFRRFVEARPDVLKLRLYELAGSFVDAAILGGGDEKKLDEFVARHTEEIDQIQDPDTAEKWLSDMAEETAGAVVHVVDSRSKTHIEKAKSYIDANYSKALSYRDVAKEVCISPSYFLSLFKAETGTTFVDFLNEVRIRRAKDLLASSNLTITEIAYDIGFKSSNYFSSIFKKLVGTSAKDYRSRRVATAS